MNDRLVSPDPQVIERAHQLPSPDYVGGTRWKVKRFVDVVVSATVLVLLSPMLLVVGLLIRLTSPGPIFFRQERITQQGRRFQCIKFRTMQPEADATPHLELLNRLIAGYEILSDEQGKGVHYKLTQDPRVTWMGRWLRKTSVDELPQLWNVLKGDMSLVGPQAPLAFEVEQYRPEWLRRLVVPAGLTGPWQVHGRGRVPYFRMIEMDLEYVDRWSLRLDFNLLLMTIPAVLFARGAH